MMGLGTIVLASATVASGSLALAARHFGSPPEDVSLKDSRRTELGLGDYLPFERLIEPNLMLLTSGALGATYEVEWHDTSVMSDSERMEYCAWINSALLKIGQKVGTDNGWMAHEHVLVTDPAPLEVPPHIHNTAHRVLYESHVEHVAPLRSATRNLWSFAYLPETGAQNRLAQALITGEREILESFGKARAAFGRGLESVEDSLRMVARIRRLGTHPDDETRSEFLEALFEVLFGDRQPIYVGKPFEEVPVGGLLAARDIAPAGIRPKVGDKHLRVLSVFDHATATNPAMYDVFRRVARPGCRFSRRLVFQDPEVSKKNLEAKKRKWKGKSIKLSTILAPGGAAQATVQTNRVAEYEARKVDDALFVSGTSTKLAWLHLSAKVVFLNDDLAALEDNLRDVRKALQNEAGLTVNVETINTLDAYFGHVPFDGYHDVREGMAHSINVSRGPGASRWVGRKTWNCKFCGPKTVPALVALSDTGEDFFVDPHDGEDRQSFIALGDSGTGKTTVLNKVDADYIRDPRDQVFGFDCNYSQFVTTKFLGGDYREQSRHWIFGDLENPDKRHFLAQFFSWIVELNGGHIENRQPILDALNDMLEDKVRNRSLTTFLGSLNPYDRPGHIVRPLAEYSREGIHRGLLDGDYDPHVGTNPREVHELGHLLGGSASERAAAPALIWLIKTIEDRLPGHRTMLFFDEAWAGLKATGVAPILEKLLLTIRYRHGGIGMFAQNPDHILKSPIGRTIAAACDMKLLFPNPNIPDRTGSGERDGSLRDVFAFDFGLNDAQIDALKTGVKKRDCAMVSGGRFGMFRLHLSPAEAAVYGCTGRDEVNAYKALLVDDPTTANEEHLLAYGCTKEAARLRSLRLHRNSNPLAIKEALA